MFRHWPHMEPALAALAPSLIVEVGAAAGRNTETLAGFAEAHGCVLHSVDPLPRFDVEDYRRRWGDAFVFHRGTSLDVLPTLHDVDATIIDGDHNWYTVINELRAIEAVATGDGRHFPLTFLHDVEWPYGRRDMYYAPDTIPEEFRQEFSDGGLVRGRPDPQHNRDFNAGVLNAVVEGTPRNGVLTAVEDFVAETALELRLQTIPGFRGLGILSDHRTLSVNETLRTLLVETFTSADFYREQCERVIEEGDRASAVVSNVRRRLRKAEKRLAELEPPPA